MCGFVVVRQTAEDNYEVSFAPAGVAKAKAGSVFSISESLRDIKGFTAPNDRTVPPMLLSTGALKATLLACGNPSWRWKLSQWGLEAGSIYRASLHEVLLSSPVSESPQVFGVHLMGWETSPHMLAVFPCPYWFVSSPAALPCCSGQQGGGSDPGAAGDAPQWGKRAQEWLMAGEEMCLGCAALPQGLEFGFLHGQGLLSSLQAGFFL